MMVKCLMVRYLMVTYLATKYLTVRPTAVVDIGMRTPTRPVKIF